MNEAASYHVAGQEMLRHDAPQSRTIPSFMLFDATWRRSYPLGPLIPDLPDWLQPKNLMAVLVRADSWEELAAKTQLPAERLQGDDHALQRARARRHRPGLQARRERLRPLLRRPAGSRRTRRCGRSSGRRSTPCRSTRATSAPTAAWRPTSMRRCWTRGGAPIAGLYACGNIAASVMGHSYPAAGATLGPGMTFGYLAVRHALGLDPP